MRQHRTTLFALVSLITLGSMSGAASAQASSYCPVYADSNWRLSWVEVELHAWLEDDRGSTSFDDHLAFCRDVFRSEPDDAARILQDEWAFRHARIVDRLSTWGAKDMVAYLHSWPDRLAYICDNYAGFNVGLSQMAEYLDSSVGSLVESEHSDYCVNSVYQNDDYGLEVQEQWAQRYDSVMTLVHEYAAR